MTLHTSMSNTDKVNLRIYLLGEFRVLVHGRAIAPRAWRLRRARQLIKLLALTPSHSLAPEVIVETLWRDVSLDEARHSLHQVVYSARRALNTPLPLWENEMITLGLDSYVWIDVEEFQEAAEWARRMPTIENYQAALALYRGELLPEDRYAEWTLARRDALRDLDLTLRVELAELYEQQRAFDEAHILLERVVEQDPLREEAHRALMHLDARTGKRAQALKQFQILRANLARELEVEPDAETRKLYNMLRAASEDKSRVSNVPHALTSFIGRVADVSAMDKLFLRARLVTLVGAGGSGKTRLAQEWAHRAAEYENVYWVELAALTEAALLPNVLAAALNIQEQGADNLEQRIVRILRDAPCLLVLDNCEHLLDATARLAKFLLQQCPDLKILATSREPLRVWGEHLWDVASLAYPRETADDELDTARNADAVHLFVERAQAVNSFFAFTTENASAILNICRRLDGLPLALELAAARVNSLVVQEIDAGLNDALQLLILGERPQLPRHQTMRAAIEWSYALISSAEKNLWMRLAVFAGGFSLDAAHFICATTDDTRIFNTLTALVSKSLVQAQPSHDETRYGMLEVMRQFALEKLNAAGEMETRRAKHFEYYLALAERGNREILGAGQLEWLTRLSIEMGNLRVALEWARGETAADTLLLELCAVFWRFWYVRGWLSEGQRWLEIALARTQVINSKRAQALVGLGALLWAQGDLERAEYECRAALTLGAQYNDASSAAWAELVLGMIAQTRGEFSEAADWETQSLENFEASGEHFGKALAFHILGTVAHTRGDLTRASEWFNASLDTHRALGNLWGAALPLYALGTIPQAEGRWEEAKEFFQQSYALFRAVGSQFGLGLNANNLGLVALEEDEFERAAQWLAESIKHYEKAGDPLGIARVKRSQARLALRQGDVSRAHALARESLQSCSQLGDQVSTIESLELLAVVVVMQNAFGRAAQFAGAAAQWREQLGAPPFPFDHARVAEILQRAHDALGDAEFEREWMRGKNNPRAEIVRMGLDM